MLIDIKEKFSLYWELYEAPVDWGKLNEINTFVCDLEKYLYELTRLNLHVAEHAMIRLSQGPIALEEIKELFIASIEVMASGKCSPGYNKKEVALGRTEVFNENFFCVCKEWKTEKAQLDIISVGVKGRREKTFKKALSLNISKEDFEKMSNTEKKEFFNKIHQ